MDEEPAEAERDIAADDILQRLRRSRPLLRGYTDEEIIALLIQEGSSATDTNEALSSVRHVLAVARRIGDRDYECQALCALGNLLLASDRCAEAIDAFRQAEAVAVSWRDEAGAHRARTLIAQAHAECAPSLDNELTLSVIAAFDREGGAAFKAGEFETVKALFERALAMFRRLGHVELQAAALRNIGLAEAELGAFARSMSHATQALELYRQLGHFDGITLCHWLLGDAARLRGDHLDALAHLTRAMHLLRVCSDHARDCVLSSLGLTYGELGHYRLALACHHTMHDVAVMTRNRESLRISLGNLGLTWLHLGELDRAAACLREAVTWHRQMARSSKLALCLNNLGAVYHVQGDLASAARCFQEAIDIDREFKRRRDEANHLGNLGAVFAIHPDGHERAIQLCEEAMRLARECDDQGTLARCLTTAGQIAARRAEYVAASARFREALAIHRQLNAPAGVLPCLINLGAVAYETGDYADARSLAEEARDLATSNGHAAALEVALENHGLACVRLGDHGRARRSLEEAIALAERLRTLAGGTRRERMMRFSSLTKPYVALIQEILLPSGETEAAFQYIERLKARTLLEQLAGRDVILPDDVPSPLADAHKRFARRRRELELLLKGDDATLAQGNTAVAWAEWRELEREMIVLETEIDAYSPGFTQAHHVRTIAVSDIQTSLQTDTVLVELFMSVNTVHAFVVTRTEGLRAVRIDGLSAADVMAMAHRWATAYETYQQSRNHVPWFGCMDEVLQQLHRTMFTPIARLIPPGIRNIVFVPHHAFHLFPLHAMYEVRNGRRDFLIHRFHCISYSPSASAFVACSRRTRPAPELLVAIENPTGDLVFAAREVGAVASMFKRSVILGPQRRVPAHVERLVSETTAAHVVLVAAHAVGGNADTAALALTDRSMSLREQFARLDVPSCSLWDFDACETGLPPADVGDEWITLASAPLCAGAATVWSSLWVVDDEATSLLKIDAYRRLAAGRATCAEALNEAQRTMLTRASPASTPVGDRDYSHPYYWAGFISTGAV